MDTSFLEHLGAESEAWALSNGLVMGAPSSSSSSSDSKDNNDHFFVHAPFSLYPSKLPRRAFEEVVALGPIINKMIDQISRRPDFLQEVLSPSAQTDEFIRKLLEVYTTAMEEDVAQPHQLGILRADYMLQVGSNSKVTKTADDSKASAASSATGKKLKISPTSKFLQVEINTISAAFGVLSSKVTKMHRYMLGTQTQLKKFVQSSTANLPENKAVAGLVDAMAAACQLFSGDGVVMMLTQPNEKNSADQRGLELALWERHKIRMVRRTLTDVAERGKVGSDRSLTIDGLRVFVSYFRAGYHPKDYPSQSEWDALLAIERSTSVKCPSVGYHLAGTKKVQQHLSRPGVVESFLPAQEAAQLRQCFAGMWGPDEDDDETKARIADAIANPDAYVLKPQREGGGNNVWGKDISQKLASMTVKQRSAFILMERIQPLQSTVALLRAGKVITGVGVSELGVYSTFLGNGSDAPRVNRHAGHLLRTKLLGVNEGGVASGFAVLDSPLLVDT